MDETLADLGEIETVLLRLTPLRFEDATAVCAVTNDRTITDTIDFLPTPFTLADAAALARPGRELRDRFIGIWQKSDDQLAGVMGAHLRGPAELEIGYWIGSVFRGRGYATEACRALVASLARAFPKRQIIAECRPENRTSWRVLEKLGFASTGKAGNRRGRQLLVLPRRPA